MVTVVLVIALLFAVSKWIIWRLSFMAVLYYYGERGQEFPNDEDIRRCQTEVALKSLGLKN